MAEMNSEILKPPPTQAVVVNDNGESNNSGMYHVQALYANIGEDSDELSFSKGEILTVTGQVNSEWLICSLGHTTGIVPANFVQEVKI